MSLIPPWLRPPRVRERLAFYHLRSDMLDAAAAMVSDQRSDIYVVRLESSLTDSETVLRMMDGRHARVIGLLVLTSERILFRSRRRTGPNFSVPLEEILAIEAYTRRGTGTVCVITPYGSLTVDQILGRQGEMLADDARATICGEPLPEPDPLRLLAKLRALRDSGAINAAEFEVRKSAIWRDV
jgi:Short C-terminal domain